MNSRDIDRRELALMPRETVLDLMFMHIRNTWAVDGLYFLGIEERFGTESATDIDGHVWEIMGKIEARRIKETLDIHDDGLPSLLTALKATSWALDLEDKEIVSEHDKVILRNTSCRTQKTRLGKGLGEFPCRTVRWGYLKTFAREINEKISVRCNTCPPGEHTEDVWCEWVFFMEE